MTTARLLSDRPQLKILEDGSRELVADVAVDLGVPESGLIDWYTSHDPRPAGGCVWLLQSRHAGIRVKPGFRYDGASIPWWAHRIMGARELYEVAGLCHDWLYRVQAPRDISDRIFHRIATSGSKRVGPVRGWLGWAALRVGGWIAYRSQD